MGKSRIRSTLINTSISILTRCVSLLANFIIRTVFIYTLGIEYLGVSAVFTDILIVLSFAELGIGTAITYALYKPLAIKDYYKVAQLMHFYKKAYRYIAIIVGILGMCLVPFLDIIITDVPNIKDNITVIYLMYVFNASISYLLIFKGTLLIANQENYRKSIVNIYITILKTIVQIIILLLYKNFILYLALEIVFTIIQNYIISKVVDRLFSNIKEINFTPLEKSETKNILKDIKALSFYKFSGVMLNATDSILISSFLGTSIAGLISNYNLLYNQIYTLVYQFFEAITASLGNLAALESKEKQFEVFELLNFIGFWIFGTLSTILFIVIEPFINLWIGEGYLLGTTISLLLCVDFYLKGMTTVVATFRTSNGLFVQGQYRPLIMALINLILSILGILIIGLPGVILGTITARVVTQMWYDPYVVYKNLFQRPVKLYFIKFIRYSLTSIVSCYLIWKINEILIYTYNFPPFILKIIVSVIGTNLLFLILFWKSNEFKQAIKYVKDYVHMRKTSPR